MRQCPSAFEFNDKFLMVSSTHTFTINDEVIVVLRMYIHVHVLIHVTQPLTHTLTHTHTLPSGRVILTLTLPPTTHTHTHTHTLYHPLIHSLYHPHIHTHTHTLSTTHPTPTQCLAEESYSGRFGTFMTDCENMRKQVNNIIMTSNPKQPSHTRASSWESVLV